MINFKFLKINFIFWRKNIKSYSAFFFLLNNLEKIFSCNLPELKIVLNRLSNHIHNLNFKKKLKFDWFPDNKIKLKIYFVNFPNNKI